MNWLGVCVLAGTLSAPVFVALLAIYVSSRNIPWYAKYLLVAASTAPLLYTRTPELMLILIVAGWTALLLLGRLNGSHCDRAAQATEPGRQPATRFQLGDILWSMSLAAVVLAVVAQFEAPNTMQLTTINTRVVEMVRLLCWGLALGTSTIAIGFLWHARRKPRHLILFIGLLSVSLFGIVWQNESLVGLLQFVMMFVGGNVLPTFSFVAQINATHALGSLAIYIFDISAMTALLSWALGLNFAPASTKELIPRDSEKQQIQRPVWAISRLCVRCLTIASGFLVMGSLVCCFATLLPPENFSPTQPYDSARPNGLLKLLAAAKDLSPVLDNGPPVALGKKTQAQIDANQNCFDRFEEGLACGNFAWMDWENLDNLVASPGSSYLFDYGDTAGEARNIARAFNFRALQSLHESRFDDVAADAVRGFQVAEAINQDPLIIGSLVSTAMEGIFYSTAFSCLSGASEDSLTRLHKQLNTIQARNPDAAEEIVILSSAEKWIVWSKGSLTERFAAASMFNEELISNVLMSVKRRNVYRRLLQTEIAIELFRRQHQRPPKNLKELVPAFLTKVPADPFRPTAASGPLSYRLSQDGTDYTLYSFGVNEVDDKGEVAVDDYNEGDFNLRTKTGDLLAKHAAEVEEYEAEQKRLAEDDLDFTEDLGDDLLGNDFDFPELDDE